MKHQASDISVIQDELTGKLFSGEFAKKNGLTGVSFSGVSKISGATAKRLVETMVVNDDESILKILIEYGPKNKTIDQLPTEYKGVTLMYDQIGIVKAYSEEENVENRA